MVKLPANLQPEIGPDFNPVGQVYFYTLRSTNPNTTRWNWSPLQDWSW